MRSPLALGSAHDTKTNYRGRASERGMQSFGLQARKGAATSRPGRKTACGGRTRRALAVRVQANPAGTDKYDYIIVGGGTAGCVLANRLSADENKRVLVLEAGGKGGALLTRVPAGLTRLFGHPTLDWGLHTVLQPPLGSRDVYLARGRLLGGSSATNATLYLRGSAADYDAWGLEGWKAADVLDWFVDSEGNASGASAYHGAGGSMRVESPRYDNPLHADFFAAAGRAGVPTNPDFNDWSRPQAGCGEFQVTQRNGRRADAFTTHLKPVLGRANLRVVTGARTTRVALEQRSGGGGADAPPRAAGVEFAIGGRNGESFSAELAPNGEVIMCGGTVATPQLLMLSGLGPQAELAQHGIAQQGVQDLPGVGRDLQDHPATLCSSRFKPEHAAKALTSQIYSPSNSVRIGAVLQLLLRGRGPLATTGCDHGAFVDSTGNNGEADLQIRFVPAFALDPDAIASYVEYGRLKAAGKTWPAGLTMQLLAARPRSRGRVGLRSADPFDLPLVDTAYFTDAGGEDMATLIRGIRLAREIARQPELAQYCEEEGWPGAATTSDADLEAFVRRTACSGNALVGSCRMGASSADGSVVSAADFKVWGVDGLRVADASTVPRIPGGQTGAVTVMIAERAAAALGARAPAPRSTAGSAGTGVREPALAA